MTSEETAAYLSMSGRTYTPWGQARQACEIGMALPTRALLTDLRSAGATTAPCTGEHPSPAKRCPSQDEQTPLRHEYGTA